MIRYVNAINNLSALNAHGQFIYIFLFLWGTVLLLSQSLRETRVNKQPWIRCGSSAEMRLGRLTYWLQVHAVRSICEEAMPSDALLLPSYTIMDMRSPCLLVHPHPSSPFWCHGCRWGYWAIALCIVLALNRHHLPLRLSSSERISCDKRQWLSL